MGDVSETHKEARETIRRNGTNHLDRVPCSTLLDPQGHLIGTFMQQNTAEAAVRHDDVDLMQDMILRS